MIKNDKRKLVMNLDTLCYRLSLDDRLKNLSQLVKIIQTTMPNLKVKWAFLNQSPDVITDFVIISEIYNNKAQEGMKEQYHVILPPFMSLSGLHSFNKVKAISAKILQDYLHDLNLEAILIPRFLFSEWLEAIDFGFPSKIEKETVYEENDIEQLNPIEKPKMIYGLSIKNDAENYFASEELLPIFMDNLEKFKNDYDTMRASYTR